MGYFLTSTKWLCDRTTPVNRKTCLFGIMTVILTFNKLKQRSELLEMAATDIREYLEMLLDCPLTSPPRGERGIDMVFAKDHPIFLAYISMVEDILSSKG